MGGHLKSICLSGVSKVKNWISALGKFPHKAIEKHL